jgi:hypothetical protein
LQAHPRAHPSQSLKGVAGDVIILEACKTPHAPIRHPHTRAPAQEAAYCDPGLISEVIIPLLRHR